MCNVRAVIAVSSIRFAQKSRVHHRRVEEIRNVHWVCVSMAFVLGIINKLGTANSEHIISLSL